MPESNAGPASWFNSTTSLPVWAWVLLFFVSGGSGSLGGSFLRYDKFSGTQGEQLDNRLTRKIHRLVEDHDRRIAAQDIQHKQELERTTRTFGRTIEEALFIAFDNQPPDPLKARVESLEQAMDECAAPKRYFPPTRRWNDVTRPEIRKMFKGLTR